MQLTRISGAQGIAAAALAALAFGASAACAATLTGSGRSLTQQRQVAGFSGVGLSVPGRLEIVQGDSEGVTISADDNVIGEIETVVERGSLQIRLKRRGLDLRNTSIRITVQARTLEAISVAGSGDVVAPALQGKQLSVHVAGSGNVQLGGRAEALRLRISGSGDVKAGRFETQRADISIAGSGDATVWARQSLEVSVAGSGNVRYYGDPTVAKKIAGSGSVRRAGASPG